MNIKINPEYSNLIPAMSEQEFNSLVEDIREHGQKYAVILNQNGIMIDGHHRDKACKKLGIETTTETRTFNSVGEEIDFIISSNKRRNLNDFQKAEMGYNLEAIYSEAAKLRQLSSLKVGD